MSTRKALAFSYIDRYSSLIIFMVSSMIIARLLTPSDMGVYSIAMVVIGFIAPFRDFGASQYLIRERELDSNKISSIWALQLLLGVILAILIFASRQLTADFYREQRLVNIMTILSINSLLMPFGALTCAWLTRELRFGSLAVIRFVGTLSGATTSILCALLDNGPISLAYGALATNIATALVSTYYRPKHFPWLPGLSRIGELFKFGGIMSGITLMNIFYKNSPELILGRIQGMAETGMFGRANSVIEIFNRVIMDSVYSIALPMFSKVLREGGDIGKTYVNGLALLTGVGWSVLLYMAIVADPLVNFLYGSQWNEAIKVTRLLCLAISILIPGYLLSSPLTSLGHIKTVFFLSTGGAIIQGVCSLIGATYDIQTLGLLICLSSFLICLLWLTFSISKINFSIKSFFKECSRSMATALGGNLVVIIFMNSNYLPSINNKIVVLIFSAILFLISFLLSANATNHTIDKEFKKILHFIRPAIFK